MSEYKVNRIGIIEYDIRKVFPNSEIEIREYINPKYPDVIEYVAFVDGVSALVTVMKDQYYSTAEISANLIYLINERRNER